jgi:hypothetical protein
VDWLEQTGFWPAEIPMVHSANPAGKFYMERVIARHYFGTAIEEAQACLQHSGDSAYYYDRRRESRSAAEPLGEDPACHTSGGE